MQDALVLNDNTIDTDIPLDLVSYGRDKFTYGEVTDWFELLEMVIKHCPDHMRFHLKALDIGAGHGRMSEWFEHFKYFEHLLHFKGT